MLQGDSVTALGTMSGTSLDGVDAAVLQTDGVHIHGFGPTGYRAYTPGEQKVLRAHLGRWQTDDCSAAEEIVTSAHLQVMEGIKGVVIAGFHGQTLAHDPAGRGTHQCGDGAALARALGYPVAWDFRSADVAAGGQGAPLASFYHFALAKWLQTTRPVVFVNLGGVGNITWIDPQMNDAADQGAVIACDTGPANAPMNDLLLARRGQAFDRDGALAMAGKIDMDIVTSALAQPYFSRPAPKSLDRDDFAMLGDHVTHLTDADALATLAQIAVAAVAAAIRTCPAEPAQVFVTGGGRRNKAIMTGLQSTLSCPVVAVEMVGLDGDMIEAQAFAYLAVRVARGLPLTAPDTTGIAQPVTGGHMSYP